MGLCCCVGEETAAPQEDERDLYHSSAVQQCMNYAGCSIILTLPLIYLIISLSMHIIAVAGVCVMNSLFDERCMVPLLLTYGERTVRAVELRNLILDYIINVDLVLLCL